jgi:hypothetical protein
MGDAGKFYKVDFFKNSYYFSIDDDLIYPKNYVENTLNELKSVQDQSIVTYHGKIFKNETKSYHDVNENFRCLDVVKENKEIDFPGTGVMCFHTSYFKLRFSDFDFPNIADTIVGIEIKNQNKKCIVLKHEKNWINHSEKIDLDQTLFLKNKNNLNLNLVFQRRNFPKICIITTMWGRHHLTDYVFNYYNKLKSELKNELNLILISCGSEGEISKSIAEKNNFFYIESDNFPLSQKHNKVFLKSKEFNPDGVILIGSDDLISKELILTYKKIMSSYDLIGAKDFYFLQNDGQFRYWPGYENYRKGEPIGGGRFYNKSLLDSLEWRPWGNICVNKSLDYHFYSRIDKDKTKVIDSSEENGIVFTIRGETNITTMKNVGIEYKGNLIDKLIDSRVNLLNLQNNLLNNE